MKGLLVLAFSCLLGLPRALRAQEPAGQPVGRNLADVEFAPTPGLPTCVVGAVQNGDPTKGPSVILAKQGAGCVVPWHWHTPNEHLMIVSGEARLETKDAEPITLRAGGFALMPSRHVHQASCTTPCTLFVYSDAAFDIHYLDAKGNEISPDEALKAVKETTVKPMR